jgi:hypoxanthine phosphoribosyltransferase
MIKIHYDWNDLEKDINYLALKVALSGWKPDYIVGISRGGCVPAVMLSHLLGVPMAPLRLSLDDLDNCVTDCGMAEDAYGYGQERAKNILIVDDINDTGATFQWIMKDWPDSCLPEEPRWQSVWHQNVKFLTLFNNASSDFSDVDFSAREINKLEQDIWVRFPWENSRD